MALPRLLLAWVLVCLWLLVWHEIRRRLAAGVPSLRAALPSLALEALLLSLLAGLWFGSLGHGGWLLLFLLTGALVELPLRLRDHPPRTLPWAQVAGGILRVIGAGGILAWRLE